MLRPLDGELGAPGQRTRIRPINPLNVRIGDVIELSCLCKERGVDLSVGVNSLNLETLELFQVVNPHDIIYLEIRAVPGVLELTLSRRNAFLKWDPSSDGARRVLRVVTRWLRARISWRTLLWRFEYQIASLALLILLAAIFAGSRAVGGGVATIAALWGVVILALRPKRLGIEYCSFSP